MILQKGNKLSQIHIFKKPGPGIRLLAHCSFAHLLILHIRSSLIAHTLFRSFRSNQILAKKI